MNDDISRMRTHLLDCRDQSWETWSKSIKRTEGDIRSNGRVMCFFGLIIVFHVFAIGWLGLLAILGLIPLICLHKFLKKHKKETEDIRDEYFNMWSESIVNFDKQFPIEGQETPLPDV